MRVLFLILLSITAVGLHSSSPGMDHHIFGFDGTKAIDTITWNFEDSTTQNWTHTAVYFTYPRAWGVQVYNAGYDTAFYCPNHGNYSMWIDSDAAGTSVADTAISPPFRDVPGNYLKWGFCFESYSGNDFLRVLLRSCVSNTWSTWSQLKNYNTTFNTAWDSIDLSVYTADSFQVAFVYAGNYDWYAAFDNVGPVIVELPNYHDVGVFSILSPKVNVSPVPVNVRCVVKNYGGYGESFNVRCIIEDSTSTVFDQTQSAITTVWGYDSVNFGSFSPQNNCDYTVRFETQLTGDANPDNDTMSRTVQCRDVWWEVLPSMPNPKWSAVSGWHIDNYGNTIIHVFSSISNTDTLEYRYNVTTRSWSGPYSVPVKICRGGAVSFMDKIYILSHNALGDSTLILNTLNGTWTKGAPLPESLTYIMTAFARDRGLIYTIGGYFCNVACNEVNVYDIAGDSFFSATPFPCSIGSGAAGYIGNDTIIVSTGYVLGIGSVTTTYFGVINSSNPSQITWSQGPDYPGSAVMSSGCAEWVDRMYVIGGLSGSNYVGTCCVYVSNTGWIMLPDKPTGRAFIATCSAPIDTSLADSTHEIMVFAAGGYSPSSNTFEALHAFAFSTYVENVPVEYSGPAVFRLLSSNIFNGRVVIELSLPHVSSLRFTVHDATGRLIREDNFSVIDQGIHRLTWEGKDGRDFDVSPGVYFFSVETGEDRFSGKVIVTR